MPQAIIGFVVFQEELKIQRAIGLVFILVGSIVMEFHQATISTIEKTKDKGK